MIDYGCNDKDLTGFETCAKRAFHPWRPQGFDCKFYPYSFAQFELRHHSPVPNVCPPAAADRVTS